MELRVFRNGGVSVNGRPQSGLTVQAPVEVLLTPIYAKEVVSKAYVDGFDFGSLGIDKITSGYVLFSTFKSRISGDVTVNGSDQLSIINSIEPGGYFKLTVSAKGLVTGATTLTESDIPNLSWSKITLDKPTDASGYGITDVVLTSNTTVTSNFTAVQHPASNKEAATKFYTDNSADKLNSENIRTGDIVLKPTSTTPSGYLRANGASVSTTTYAALYAVIGLNGGSNPPANTFYLPNMTSNEYAQYCYYIKT